MREFIVSNEYYIYACYVDDQVKYIGMGKGNRYRHCTSGKSSCLELNRDYFLGLKMETLLVFESLTREDAMLREREIIISMGIDKLYNKNGGSNIGLIEAAIKSGSKGNSSLPKRCTALLYDVYTNLQDKSKVSYNTLDNIVSRCNIKYRYPLNGCGTTKFSIKLMSMFGYSFSKDTYTKVNHVDIHKVIAELMNKATIY